MLDALAYLKAARAAGAAAALEVSRSGLGAHVWLFFTGTVAAVTARQVGSGMLREAIARRRGASVFLDLATLEPYEDHWAYLSSVARLSPREVTQLARRPGEVNVGATVDRLRVATSTRISVQPPTVVHSCAATTRPSPGT